VIEWPSLRIDDEIELRILREEDAEELFAMVDANRQHLRTFLDWVDVNTEPSHTLSFIQMVQEEFTREENITTGIWHRDRIAGCLTVENIDGKHGHGELGYWLAETYQGTGMMYAACSVFIDHLFTKVDLNRLMIRAAMENGRSRSLAKRLGFTQEGVQREAYLLYGKYHDLAMYSLLSSEWRVTRSNDR
jgi:ribosomal-protein-serine acetyltransferase